MVGIGLATGMLVVMLLMTVVFIRQQLQLDRLARHALATDRRVRTNNREHDDLFDLLNRLCDEQNHLTERIDAHEVSISRAYLAALQAKQEIMRLTDDPDGWRASVEITTELLTEAVKEMAVALGPLYPFSTRNFVRIAAELHAHSFFDEPGSEAFQRRVKQFLTRCDLPNTSFLQVMPTEAKN